MELSLYGLAICVTLGVAFLIPGAAEAQVCRHCEPGDGEECGTGDDKNVDWDGFTGNQDGAHGCFAHTCYYMMLQLVHLEGPCDEEETPSADLMPLADLQSLEDLSLEYVNSHEHDPPERLSFSPA